MDVILVSPIRKNGWIDEPVRVLDAFELCPAIGPSNVAWILNGLDNGYYYETAYITKRGEVIPMRLN